MYEIFNVYYCSTTVQTLDFEAFRQSGFSCRSWFGLVLFGLGPVFSGLGLGPEGTLVLTSLRVNFRLRC